jgi:hypothetical protein
MKEEDKFIIYPATSTEELMYLLERRPKKYSMPLLVDSTSEAMIIDAGFKKIDGDFFQLDCKRQLLFSNNFIYSDKENSCSRIAEHYASFFNRTFINSFSFRNGFKLAYHHLKSSSLSSCTVFVPMDIMDTYRWKRAIETSVENFIKVKISFGYIMNMPIEKLCFFLLKNIIGIVAKNNRQKEEMDKIFVATEPELKREGIIEELNYHKNNLYILAHSNPHCGVLNFPDESIALCASPSKGEGGKCFSNFDCIHKNNKKVYLENLQADFIFLNGCSTGRINSTVDGIPLSALTSYASTLNNTRCFIGNHNIGRYSEADIDWMRALLFLKIKPSIITYLINVLRKVEGRQNEESCIFFGDAESRVEADNSQITVLFLNFSEEMVLEWNDNRPLLCVVVKGKYLSQLASSDQIRIDSDVNLLYGTVLYNDFDDNSIILFKKDGSVENQSFKIFIRTLKEPVDKSIGDGLEKLVWVFRSFSSIKPYNQLEKMEDLGNLERAVINMRNLANCYDRKVNQVARIEEYRKWEYGFIAGVNEKLIKAAQNTSQGGYWKIEDEYAQFYILNFKKEKVEELNCLLCGGATFKYTSSLSMNSFIKIESSICSSCNTFVDIPSVNLLCSLIGNPPEVTDEAYTDYAYFANNSEEDMVITYGLGIRDLVSEKAILQCPESIILPKKKSTKVKCSFLLDKRPSRFGSIRLYVAVNGMVGSVTRSYIFHDDDSKRNM